jgi:hypothetical protein
MTTTPHRLAGLLTAGLTAAAALTGCTAATTPIGASTPVSVKPVRTSRTIASPAPPTSNAPALTNTGTTWPKVVGSLVTYGQWLLANPNPGLANTITVPGCAADDMLTAELRTYVGQGAYVQPVAPILTSISGPVGAVGGQVTVDIQAVRGAEAVYQRAIPGSTTHVTADRPQLAPTALRLNLIRGADSRWRVCTVTDPLNSGADALSTVL